MLRPPQTVRKPLESAGGRKPFRALSVSGGVCAGAKRFPRWEVLFSGTKIASLQFSRPEIRRISAETGRGGRRQNRHAQIENLSRGARWGYFPPPVKNLSRRNIQDVDKVNRPPER